VLGALIARNRGWRPAGPFTLGSSGYLVNVLALVYGVSAIVNILWPRGAPTDPWYLTWGMLLTTVGVMGIGAIYMLLARPYERGNAPAGDAHLITRAADARDTRTSAADATAG
jgi:NhaP-type Na+/H+ or K+/H+ antiporter